MLGLYKLGSEEIDSLDLKSLLVTRGVRVSDSVYTEFGRDNRLWSRLIEDCQSPPKNG